jgi:hypothetical protein
MEKENVKPKRKRKRRSQELKLWRKILSKDLAINELSLYNETIRSRMVQEAFILERKRNPGEYIR